MSPQETAMWREAREAPEVIARQVDANASAVAGLARRLRTLKPRFAVTLARGSSDNAATYLHYLAGIRLGLPVFTLPPSLGRRGRSDRGDWTGVPVFAISQSGQSPDLVEAATALRLAGAFVTAIVNDERSPLAGAADLVVPMLAGEEWSVAATKSHLASLSALLHLVADWADDDALRSDLRNVPERLERAWEVDWAHPLATLAGVNAALVVGADLHVATAGRSL